MIPNKLNVLLALCLALVAGPGMAWQGASFKKPSPDVLRRTLTKVQYEVTQDQATEPPFRNDFYNNKQSGIYVDVVSGEPLFSSTDKFDSGTGWPSFTRPLSKEFVKTREDRSLGTVRVEVRSRYADSHLGHVFDDGPLPGGKRYCINSAAMRFIPAADLDKSGYSQFVHLFGPAKEAPTLRGPVTPAPETIGTAVFAGGCFWCMEPPFEKLDGVVSVVSGFMGGEKPDPTYEQVSAGGTGYAEVVEVRYMPGRIGYKRLLEVFWENIDPTVENRQFCDQGSQYRSAIFYGDREQETLARASRTKVIEAFRKARPDARVFTEVVPAGTFYAAGPEHQDFYKTNPIRYKEYRTGCGRDQRLREIWSGVSRNLQASPAGAQPPAGAK